MTSRMAVTAIQGGRNGHTDTCSIFREVAPVSVETTAVKNDIKNGRHGHTDGRHGHTGRHARAGRGGGPAGRGARRRATGRGSHGRWSVRPAIGVPRNSGDPAE